MCRVPKFSGDPHVLTAAHAATEAVVKSFTNCFFVLVRKGCVDLMVKKKTTRKQQSWNVHIV